MEARSGLETELTLGVHFEETRFGEANQAGLCPNGILAALGWTAKDADLTTGKEIFRGFQEVNNPLFVGRHNRAIGGGLGGLKDGWRLGVWRSQIWFPGRKEEQAIEKLVRFFLRRHGKAENVRQKRAKDARTERTDKGSPEGRNCG